MDKYERALGSLLGLFIGDAFGAQTEFDMEEDLRKKYPDGILEMDSRERNIGEPGVITDDSEMAIMLATSLMARKTFDPRDVKRRYIVWLNAEPSDLGTTIFKALREDVKDPNSQANGALMRVAPVGIYGSNFDDQKLIEMSDGDCSLTHVHTICRDVNRIWALSIAKAIRDGGTKEDIYNYMCSIAPQYTQEKEILELLEISKNQAPSRCDDWNQGWILIALQQALYTLLNYDSFEEGIREITIRGGDADTNAAIYGMLFGAIEGSQSLPKRWIEALKPTRCLEDVFPDQNLDLNVLAQKLARELTSQ
jgi:ADP-ribosylglycohydrolase